ncbi:PH domain-containing protein [Streptomyces cylindrosporus]|uniref:PH domain-containing protein n=1 Tax=Streptomyces cylindrosporus TaxID=2927583 RepID=A0ABS9Y4U0_9ACTN|nr:PH domain-containing protein [Streptomyces cylindrosporus]MCI3272024.1 PH domain-containing protein [Streptomyces cylindrosporus]
MGGDADGIERVYRRRRRPPGLVVGLLGLVCCNALLQVDGSGEDRDRWFSWMTVAALAVAAAHLVLTQYRAYTRVTREGITVQWAVRSRSWTWQQVYDIRVEPAGRGSSRTSPQWVAYLHDFDGRRFLLPHIDDRQLDDPYAEVSDLCLAADPGRSLGWERLPQVETLILRRAARRKAWIRAALGAALVLLITSAVDTWEVIVGRPEHPFLLFVCVPLASFALLGALLERRWKSLVPAQP